MTSSYHRGFDGGVFLCVIFFFLSPCQGFLPGKIRSDPFHKFVVFTLSQPGKSSVHKFLFFSFFVVFLFCFCFLISIVVGATAQHPQHTDDKGKKGRRRGGGWGGLVQKSRVH